MCLNNIITFILVGTVSLSAKEHLSSSQALHAHEQCTVEFPIIPVNISASENAKLCNLTACKKQYRLAMAVVPPFTMNYFMSQGAEIKGLFQMIVNIMMRSCCGSCANFDYTTETSSLSNLTHHMTHHTKHADILFPVLGETTASSIDDDRHYVPMLFLPGGILVYIRDSSPKALAAKLLNAVFEIWPLVIISLVLAFVAGIIIWLMDTWFNVEEFPRPFIRGSLEGFWWAFVSMTTVGYGDRSPKSIHARVFAVFWILVGITIFSMLTASLTTAITSVVVQLPPSLYGLKVGVLEDHVYETNLGSLNNVKLNYYKNMNTMKNAFIDKEIEGILLNRYSMAFYWFTMFKDIKGATTADVVDEMKTNAYGIVYTEEGSYKYFKKFMEYNKQKIQVFISKEINKVAGIKAPVSVSSSVFAIESGLFYPTLIISGVSLFFVIVGGVIYETRRRSKNRVKQNTGRKDDETTLLLKQTEQGMTTELQNLLQTWESRLRNMSHDNRNVPGSFKKDGMTPV